MFFAIVCSSQSWIAYMAKLCEKCAQFLHLPYPTSSTSPALTYLILFMLGHPYIRPKTSTTCGFHKDRQIQQISLGEIDNGTAAICREGVGVRRERGREGVQREGGDRIIHTKSASTEIKLWMALLWYCRHLSGTQNQHRNLLPGYPAPYSWNRGAAARISLCNSALVCMTLQYRQYVRVWGNICIYYLLTQHRKNLTFL